MGKKQKSQRTKGNSRPSSSGHSAELLGSTGAYGFIGFNTSLKDGPSFIPATGQHATDDAENMVDGNFRMVMRKMLKRDAITKLKAMQEFGDLCAEKEIDAIKYILPFWPRLFNRLALDTDRRVREATHQANEKLISKVKREIAPFIRNIVGVWLVCQCDSYAPASSAAKSAFSAAFPPAKQSEALMFYKDDIISYFQDNLFCQTVKSLTEQNITSEEEAENKYNLLITSTLQGLSLFLSLLNQKDKESVLNDVSNILAENKFWKYSKHKESQVREAWFSLISILCSCMSESLIKYDQKLIPAVFGSLSESDPVVAPAVWEAAIHTVANFKNCWQNIDIRKVVLPQLWTFLKEGGRGNASVLFPCLLPLLSKLPESIIEEETDFYKKFFSSIREGLLVEQVKKSPKEANSIIHAFLECLHFVICNHVSFSKNGMCLLEHLIIEELFSLIETSFRVEGAHLPVTSLYPLVGRNLWYMENQAHVEKSNQSKIFNQALTLFWVNFSGFCCSILNKECLSNIELGFLAYFFHCIHDPSAYLFKKKTKVKFQDVEAEDGKTDSNNSNVHSKEIKPKCNFSTTFLSRNTNNFCKNISWKLQEDFEPCYLKLLSEIISAGPTNELFADLLNITKISPVNENHTLVFFKEVVMNWFQKARPNAVVIDYIVSIVFSICSCLEEEDALSILNKCCVDGNTELLWRLLNKGLSEYSDDKLFCQWLKGPLFGSFVVNIVKELARIIPHATEEMDVSKIDTYCKILHLSLIETASGESVIGKEHIQEILIVLQCSLQTIDSANGEETNASLVELVCDISDRIFSNFKNCWIFSVVDDLLVSLFSLNLNGSGFNLPEKLNQKTINIWQKCIIHLVQQRKELLNKEGFLNKVTSKLHSSIINHIGSEDSTGLLKSTLLLLSTVEDAFFTEGLEFKATGYFVISALLEDILPSKEEWQHLKTGLKLDTLSAVLERKMFYPLPLGHIPFPPAVIPQHVCTAVVTSEILIKILNADRQRADNEIFAQHFKKHLPHIMWSLCFCKGNGYHKKEESKGYSCSKLMESSTLIANFLSKDEMLFLMNTLYNLSINEGHQWASPLHSILRLIISKYPDVVCDIFSLLKEVNESESKYRFHLAQAIIHYLSTEQKVELVMLLNTNIQLCEDPLLREPGVDGYLAEICCCLKNNNVLQHSEIQEKIKNILNYLIHLSKHEIISADNWNMNKEDCHVVFAVQVATFFSITIEAIPEILNKTHWHFMLSTVAEWLQVCIQIKQRITSDSAALILTHQTCSLLSTISSFLERSDVDRNLSFTLESEWKEICKMILPLFLDVADSSRKLDVLPEAIDSLLTTVTQAIGCISVEQVLTTLLPVADLKPSLQVVENVNIMLQSLIPILTCNIRPLQYGIHSVLMRIMPLLPSLIKMDSEQDDEEEDKELSQPLPSPVAELMKNTNHIVEAMLFDLRIGDCCIVRPYTDSYTYTLAYLLTWTEVLEFFTAATSEDRSGYASYLQECGLLSSLLSNLFRLMPKNPASCQEQIASPNKGHLKTVFTQLPLLSSNDPPSSRELQHIACHVYFNALKKVPALVRQWWNNQDRRISEVVKRYTSKYVSGLLCAQEIQAVHNSDIQFSNMIVKARPTAREVVATYTVDDSSIELIIQLPENYPLGPVNVNSRGKGGISQAQWRNWRLQLTTFLTYQNGSILDGLTLWKKSVDKKFEGVEECMICFYVLHSSSFRLPKLSCRTCKKKFHSSCLYKWFHTSNNATCPLCRNYF